MKTILFGHTSPDTAYVVDDYPFGFRLRCKIRYWVEYKKGFGRRVVSQTSDPRSPVLSWNKPKPGNYYMYAALVLDKSNGHIETAVLSSSNVHTWWKFYSAGFAHAPDMPEAEQKVIDACRSHFNRECPDGMGRVLEISGKLAGIIREGATKDVLKAELEAKMHQRFYDADWDDAYDVTMYERSRVTL